MPVNQTPYGKRLANRRFPAAASIAPRETTTFQRRFLHRPANRQMILTPRQLKRHRQIRPAKFHKITPARLFPLRVLHLRQRRNVSPFLRNFLSALACLIFISGIGFLQRIIFSRAPARFFLLCFRRIFLFRYGNDLVRFFANFRHFSPVAFRSSLVISGVFFIKKWKYYLKKSVCFSPASAVAVRRFTFQKVPVPPMRVLHFFARQGFSDFVVKIVFGAIMVCG